MDENDSNFKKTCFFLKKIKINPITYISPKSDAGSWELNKWQTQKCWQTNDTQMKTKPTTLSMRETKARNEEDKMNEFLSHFLSFNKRSTR